MKYQMGLGLLAAGAMAPEMLKKYAALTVTRETNNTTRVAVDIQYAKLKSRLHLLFDQNGKPLSGQFYTKNITASLQISEWQLDALTPPDFFAAPDERQSQAVNQSDALRMTAAIFERLIESAN